MKKLIKIYCFLLVVSSCINVNDTYTDDSTTTNNPYLMNLEDILGTNSNTDFNVYLEDLNGEKVNELSQLDYKNEYYVIIESLSPAFHRIGLKSGFAIISNENDQESPKFISRFKIKLTDEIANGIGLSVIIIHKNQEKYLRESPKRLILP